MLWFALASCWIATIRTYFMLSLTFSGHTQYYMRLTKLSEVHFSPHKCVPVYYHCVQAKLCVPYMRWTETIRYIWNEYIIFSFFPLLKTVVSFFCCGFLVCVIRISRIQKSHMKRYFIFEVSNYFSINEHTIQISSPSGWKEGGILD